MLARACVLCDRRQWLRAAASGLPALNVLEDDLQAQQPWDRSVEQWMSVWMNAPCLVKPVALGKFLEPVYYLRRPVEWLPASGQEGFEAVTAPAGFVTDFSSIPRPFWSLVRPNEAHARAAVIHEYLYWTQTLPRSGADAVFRETLQDLGLNRTLLTVIHDAVRIAGKFVWSANAELRSLGEERILRRFPRNPLTRWSDWKHVFGVFAG